MDQQLSEVLEKALQHGGQNLSPKQMGLAGKGNKEYLEKLLESEYLQIQGKKYSLSPKAFTKSKKISSYASIRKDSITQFLKVLEQKNGRKLTSKDQKLIHPTWLKEIIQENLIQEDKKDTYQLREKGKKFLFDSLPLQEQIRIHQDLCQSEIQSAQEKYNILQKEIQAATHKIHESLSSKSWQQVKNKLTQQVDTAIEKANQEFQTAMRELADTGRLQEAIFLHEKSIAQVTQNAKEQIADQFSKLEQQQKATEDIIESTNTQYQEKKQELETIQDSIHQSHKAMQEMVRSASLQETTDRSSNKNSGKNKVSKPSFQEEDVLNFMVQQHKKLCKENSRRAGSVTIPEMWGFATQQI